MKAAVVVALILLPLSAWAELPLVEIPAKGEAKAIAVLYSGDGGWWGFEDGIAKDLAAQGVSVIGWNTLKYFWSRHTAQQAADDLAAVLDSHAATGKEPILLVGYSYGADVLPFIAAKLPPRLATRLLRVSLINPGHNADLVFHFSSWAGDYQHADSLKVLQGMAALNVPTLCVCGQTDSDCSCLESKAPNVRSLVLPGGHRLSGDHARVASEILR